MNKIAMGITLVLGVAWSAAPLAQAITVDEVIELARSDAQDGLIMAAIDTDQTVFQLTVGEILELSDAGVSDPVITYMINTGKNISGGENGDADAVESPEEIPESDAVYEDEYEDQDDYGDDDDSGAWALGLGYSNTGFGVAIGYYYPSWPGYHYSAYYDPFFWPAWGDYYSYWSPYPYWRWYSQTYACYTYSHPYWYGYSTPYPYYGSHHGHGYVHKDYHDSYAYKGESEGRYAGSRGSVHRGTRRENYREDSRALAANNRIIGTPRRPGTRVVKTSDVAPAPQRGYTLRRPRVTVRKEKPQEIHTPRQLPDRRPQVTPRKRVEVKPDQPKSKVTRRSQDSKSRRIHKPAPQHNRKSNPSGSRPSGSRKTTRKRGGGGAR